MENQECNYYKSLATVFLPKFGDTLWKKEFVEELIKLNNDQLFQRVIDEQQPDDYDGCFTKRHEWEASISLQILEYKLKVDGWLLESN